ncbi:MAG: hypothetical protein WBP86_10600 [Thiobacillaceae bacterium]
MKQPAWIFFGSTLFATWACAQAPAEPAKPAPLPTSPGSQPAPTTISEWADRCTDFTVNGWGFKDPKNFVKLTELFSHPDIYLEFSRRMEDPESYARVAGSMMDPRTVKNYMEWSDPVIYTKWMQASMDPNFYLEAMRPFMDPSTYLHWMALPMDQRAWSVAANMMNPAMWMKWMTAGTNPKVTGPLAKVADASMPTQWLQAAGDPANYRAWTGWSPTPTQGQNSGFTPFNPGTWFGAPRSTNLAPKLENGEGSKP